MDDDMRSLASLVSNSTIPNDIADMETLEEDEEEQGNHSLNPSRQNISEQFYFSLTLYCSFSFLREIMGGQLTVDCYEFVILCLCSLC